MAAHPDHQGPTVFLTCHRKAMSKRAIDRFRLLATPKLQTPSEGDPPTSKSLQDLSETTTGQAALSNTNADQPKIPVVEPASPGTRAIALTAQTQAWIAKLKRVCRRAHSLKVANRAATQITQGARTLGMPLVWIGVAAFCVGTGYSAFVWLTSIPPAPDCDRLWFFSLAPDKLFCAEQAARSRDEASLLTALNLLKHWSAYDPLSKRVVQLRLEWSKALLAIADQKALNNDIAGAIQLARQIQAHNPGYPNAQKAVLEWENSGATIKAVEATVETALNARNWKRAEEHLQALQGLRSAYGQQQFNRLRERVVRERVAASRLQQLRELVNAKPSDDVETWGRAIQLALQISPNTKTRAEADNDISQWMRSLVETASARLGEGDVSGAIAAVQWLPENTSLPADLQGLFWLNRAQQLSASEPAARSSTDIRNIREQWQRITTLAAMRHIQSNNRFYARAQPQISELEQRLQDSTQLQLATRLANLQQAATLQLAIHLAEEITRDRPQRPQAQALIAVWRKDMQRADDRPYLLAAQRLARSGKIPDLKAAIAQASRIPLGRALRPDAQAAIFDWRQQMQTIEDQPLLNQARQLAKRNKLSAAIQIAAQIPPGRALYTEAQAAIQSWIATLQTAEDRPILDRAIAIADQGRFGAAIDMANRITPERALYDQAQAAIVRWSAQLETRRSRSGAANRDDE